MTTRDSERTSADLVRLIRRYLALPICVVLAALVVFGGLYAMQAFFEPVPKETTAPPVGVKVRR